MKTKDMKKLALMGITAGLISMGSSEIQALDAEAIALDLDRVVSKAKCNEHGGCGGLTASRDVNVKKGTLDDEDELNEDEKEDDEYDDHLDSLPN